MRGVLKRRHFAKLTPYCHLNPHPRVLFNGLVIMEGGENDKNQHHIRKNVAKYA